MRSSSSLRLPVLSLAVVLLAGAGLPAFAADAASAAASPASAPARVSAPALVRPPVQPYDVNDFVGDHSQAEWAEAYHQWVASFVRGASPISDTTGALCASSQQGEVWFLAGSDGTAPVVRQCAVPAGKPLFVAIVATVERSGNVEPDCPSLVRIAANTLAHVEGLALSIDGIEVDDVALHRVPSNECFALGLRQVPRSAARTAVSDGYYVALPPLPAGVHTLVAAARFEGTAISTTYKLDVR